jgi:Rieske Fe-S protein
VTDPTQRADLEPGALSAQRPAARARRRTLLQAAGLVTLAGGGTAVLAACSSGSTASGTPATSAPGSPSAVASSSAPSGSTSKSAATTPSGPSVAESSVPEGSGVIMSDADYVVTQPSKGEFKAFSKICTHQGCVVADVSTTIDCMCHGSRFSITDGSVVNGPANAPLAESKTTVSGGNVYVEG